MFALASFVSLAVLASAAPSQPVMPPSYSVNVNLTVGSAGGVTWNYIAGYYAPNKVTAVVSSEVTVCLSELTLVIQCIVFFSC
jgi:hypothetical protein